MEFANSFTVFAPIDQAWALLTDVPRIAPCLPGATVTHLADNDFEGSIIVKVGPIKLAYGGTVSFDSLDLDKHAMTLNARGRENSGKGSAEALIRVELSERAEGQTDVRVVTNLQIAGKVAQFGRSAMANVGARLIAQFAANLEAMIVADGRP
jgi:carbon monoxide dehydrogenase subunit G